MGWLHPATTIPHKLSTVTPNLHLPLNAHDCQDSYSKVIGRDNSRIQLTLLMPDGELGRTLCRGGLSQPWPACFLLTGAELLAAAPWASVAPWRPPGVGGAKVGNPRKGSEEGIVPGAHSRGTVSLITGTISIFFGPFSILF